MTKYTCVLIEEDRMVASLMKFRLKRLQFEVLRINNANRQTLASIKADVAVVGLHANSVTNLETLKEVRVAIGDNTPLVTLISNYRQRLVIEHNNVQVEAFLLRPVNLTEFENTIVQIVNSKAPSNKLLS